MEKGPKPAQGIFLANEDEVQDLDMKTFNMILSMKAKSDYGIDLD